MRQAKQKKTLRYYSVGFAMNDYGTNYLIYKKQPFELKAISEVLYYNKLHLASELGPALETIREDILNGTLEVTPQNEYLLRKDGTPYNFRRHISIVSNDNK